MKVLSLFSGIGGFDLGFERAGMEIVGMCEIDKHAQKILTRHFPAATLHNDVREVVYAQGTIDIICGGFPCQDISVAGKRKGLDGNRSGLWYRFADIIANTMPLWVVIENVPGLLTSNNGYDFGIILHWLAKCGYGVGWRILDAQSFGLAQRRKRVFIVGSLGTSRGCTLLLERESMCGNNSSRKQAKESNSTTTSKCLTSHSGRFDASVETFIPYSIQGTIIDRSEISGSNGIGISQNNVSYTLTAIDRHAVGTLWESSHGYDPCRVSTNQNIVPTLSAKMGTGGNNVPNVGVRRLTPTECERLQGFPDGWTSGQSDTQRYKQLGNAVAVPVAEWIGNRIMEASNE